MFFEMTCALPMRPVGLKVPNVNWDREDLGPGCEASPTRTIPKRTQSRTGIALANLVNQGYATIRWLICRCLVKPCRETQLQSAFKVKHRAHRTIRRQNKREGQTDTPNTMVVRTIAPKRHLCPHHHSILASTSPSRGLLERRPRICCICASNIAAMFC